MTRAFLLRLRGALTSYRDRSSTQNNEPPMPSPAPGCRVCSAHMRLAAHSLITGSVSQSRHCADVIARHPHRIARAM
ncbi:hypothetical protein NBG84_22545 [Streptomyces sp. CWNU-1]|uniref:Uncharacterized protein n=1 Tax=Streptomyces albipurpureus TaxID=2897419 RepID=A0ABT0URQ0_9ACTN|nr:hypothetical protein [Streptomyces sp. CWNU-1]